MRKSGINTAPWLMFPGARSRYSLQLSGRCGLCLLQRGMLGGGGAGGAHNCSATLPSVTGAQPHIGKIDSPAQHFYREIF